jgi:hypothetical protein
LRSHRRCRRGRARRPLVGADTLDFAPLAGIRIRDAFIATTVEQLWLEAETPDRRPTMFGDAAPVGLTP